MDRSNLPEYILVSETRGINVDIADLKKQIDGLEEKKRLLEEKVHWLRKYNELLNIRHFSVVDHESLIDHLIELRDFDKLKMLMASNAYICEECMTKTFNFLLENDKSVDEILYFRTDIPNEIRDKVNSALVLKKLLGE
jgi:hypothetical protein